jgi:hypothetical protein
VNEPQPHPPDRRDVVTRDAADGAGSCTWYFPDGDRPPVLGIRVTVPGERVRGLRVPWHDDPADAGRSAVAVREQYALRVRSDIPVICQYGRLEAVPSFALYTTMGFTR